MASQKYRLLISYDGTPFGGWQVQPNALSIQELIQNALSTVLREKNISVIGSGRTDAGVHALEQVAHFRAKPIADLKKTLRSLNALLPEEIALFDLKEVSEEFHSRFSAIGKIYRYHLHLNPVKDPFTRSTSTYYPYPLDLQRIEMALPHFPGTHDFTTFANEPHCGSLAKNPVRTLYRLDMIRNENGCIFEFVGDGFLYKMVRTLVGTLLEIGRGRIAPDEVGSLFAAKNRKRAGAAAPPQGLFLVKVIYPPQFGGISENVGKCAMPFSGTYTEEITTGLSTSAALSACNPL